MVLRLRNSLIASAALVLGACGAGEDDSIRFEYSGTTMDICAETSIGFHPDSIDLTGAAEHQLFETVDHLGIDCVGASIDITAYRNDETAEIANSRAHRIEATIVDNYDISDSRISKTLADPPTPDEAGRVHVALKVEVPLEE